MDWRRQFVQALPLDITWKVAAPQPSVDVTPSLPSQSSSAGGPFGGSVWRGGQINVAL